MSLPDRADNAELLVRARRLRLHARAVLQRAALLRHRADALLAISGTLRVRLETRRVSGTLPLFVPGDTLGDAAEAAEERAWMRAEVRRMLSSGWTRDELADIGIRPALLEELGLGQAEAA